VYCERRLGGGKGELSAAEAAERGVVALVTQHSLAAVTAALQRVVKRP
jgi:hypothetical protein